jgi:hypothetical protein
VSLCPLGGEQSSGVTRRVSDPIELAAVVAIGDPQDLAIGQAGGGREAHRSFAVDSGILQDGGRGCNPPIGSGADQAGEALTLTEGQEAGVFNPAGTEFVALDQSVRCHPLEGDSEGSPCLIGHPQSGVNVGRAHPVLIGATAAIIHRQDRKDRPLIGGTESVRAGEGGGEHGSSGLVVGVGFPSPVDRIVEHQGEDATPPMVGSATEHQISDGVGDLSAAAPANGIAAGRHHPDHALLTPDLSDRVGVVHIGCPLATVRIEGSPGGGLNCETVGHEVQV